MIFGLVAPGYEMARVAAKHLLGEAAEFAGADMSTKLKLMGVDVASIGDPHGKEGQPLLPVHRRAQADLQEDRGLRCGKYLLGGVMVGDAANTARCCR
jgi:nitrite reductase (NADH) large subunit